MYQKVCNICNKSFEAKVPHKNSCSVECRKKTFKNYRRELYVSEHGQHSGKCERCNATIEGARQKRYCSIKCKKQSEYERLNPFIDKICLCGEKFESRGTETIYCSAACINHYCKSHPPVKLFCKQCSKEFEVLFINRDRIFCSKSCSTIYTNNNRNEEEVSRKISETKKKQFASGERIHPWFGKHLSSEHKQKISDHHLENQTFNGENNPMFGKNHTTETREQISKTRTDRIVNGDYSSWFNKGKIYSSKMNKELFFRSSWEEKVIQHLDIDDTVLSFEVEPFSIEYLHKGIMKNYIPDFLIEYNDKKLLVEVKPEIFVDYEINIDKFQAAQNYCNEKGLAFEVWTEKQIQTLITTSDVL